MLIKTIEMKTQLMKYKTLKINSNFMWKPDRKMLVVYSGPLILHRSFKMQSIINYIDKIKINNLEMNRRYSNMKKYKILLLSF